MNNSKQPISPALYQRMGDGEDDFSPAQPNQKNGYETMFGGLTKLEYFAGLAMQGFLVNNIKNSHPEDIAFEAIVQAEWLLKQLETTKI